MNSISDTIFSEPNVMDTSKTLAQLSGAAPDGFTSLDLFEWLKPKLQIEKYDMAVLMQVPVPSYLNDSDRTFILIIEKVIAVCSSRRYKHSDACISFRHNSIHKQTYEKADYVNWFTKRPNTIREVARMQFCVAFKHKEISYFKFLEFVCSLYSTVYKNPALCDITVTLYRDDKPVNSMNKIWVHTRVHDIIKDMLDIKTIDCWNNTSVYATRQKFIERVATHLYLNKSQKEYERDGIEQWFKIYSKRYEDAYR